MIMANKFAHIYRKNPLLFQRDTPAPIKDIERGSFLFPSEASDRHFLESFITHVSLVGGAELLRDANRKTTASWRHSTLLIDLQGNGERLVWRRIRWS